MDLTMVIVVALLLAGVFCIYMLWRNNLVYDVRSTAIDSGEFKRFPSYFVMFYNFKLMRYNTAESLRKASLDFKG